MIRSFLIPLTKYAGVIVLMSPLFFLMQCECEDSYNYLSEKEKNFFNFESGNLPPLTNTRLNDTINFVVVSDNTFLDSSSRGGIYGSGCTSYVETRKVYFEDKNSCLNGEFTISARKDKFDFQLSINGCENYFNHYFTSSSVESVKPRSVSGIVYEEVYILLSNRYKMYFSPTVGIIRIYNKDTGVPLYDLITD